MNKFRPSWVFLGTMTLALIGKIGSLALPAHDVQFSPPPIASSFIFVGPAMAAQSETKSEDNASEMQEVKLESCQLPEEVLAEIANERKLLKQQQDAIVEREAKLQIGLDRLALEAGQLENLKSALEELTERVEAAQNEDVARLVNLYRNMKPKSAAEILNELDIEASVIVLGTMAERDAAPILANLDPNRARAISKIILERSKLPGDQDFSGIRLR